MSYQQIIKEAETFISQNAEPNVSSRKIAEYLETLMDQNKIDRHSRDVVYTYLSRAANHDSESRIVSGGPHGGYSIDKNPESSEIKDSNTEYPGLNQNQPGIKTMKKSLYPLLKLWLEINDYIAADVSNVKSGGHWGNPDLIGVSRAEILGTSEIELVSIEAKISDSGWERFIFEAVSHKRFVNRSWFCYRTTMPYPPLPKSMAYYAERYRIGILQIYLEDNELQNAAKGATESAEYLDRVQERVRGLYEAVPLQEKKAFLERAGMTLNMHVAQVIQ